MIEELRCTNCKGDKFTIYVVDSQTVFSMCINGACKQVAKIPLELKPKRVDPHMIMVAAAGMIADHAIREVLNPMVTKECPHCRGKIFDESQVK